MKKQQPKTPTSAPVLVLTGFNYGKQDKRHEIGEIVRDLPAAISDELIKGGNARLLTAEEIQSLEGAK